MIGQAGKSIDLHYSDMLIFLEIVSNSFPLFEFCHRGRLDSLTSETKLYFLNSNMWWLSN